MKWMQAALAVVIAAAGLLFIGTAIFGHEPVYAPKAVLLASTLALFINLRKKESEKR